MRLTDIPVVQWIHDTGPDDRVFDTLLLGGPVLIGLLALAGRTPLATAIVVSYLGVFCGYTAYKWAT